MQSQHISAHTLVYSITKKQQTFVLLPITTGGKTETKSSIQSALKASSKSSANTGGKLEAVSKVRTYMYIL